MSRFGVTLPTGTSTPDVVRDITAINTRLEAVGCTFDIGTLASRPAASADQKGKLYLVTDRGRPNIGLKTFCDGTQWGVIENKPVGVAGSNFPGSIGFSPVDDDEIDWDYGVLGRTWRLRYTASKPSQKWMPVGAAAIMAEGGAGVLVPVSGSSFVNIAGNLLPVPAAGRYRLVVSGDYVLQTNAPVGQLYARAWTGSGSDWTDAYALSGYLYATNLPQNTMFQCEFTSTGAGHVDVQGARVSGTGTIQFGRIQATLEPLELGT